MEKKEVYIGSDAQLREVGENGSSGRGEEGSLRRSRCTGARGSSELRDLDSPVEKKKVYVGADAQVRQAALN